MPKILKDFPDVKLVITGGGYKKKFPWLINKNIVTKKVLYNLFKRKIFQQLFFQ